MTKKGGGNKLPFFYFYSHEKFDDSKGKLPQTIRYRR